MNTTTTPPVFDFAIAGGGLSGLALARGLVARPDAGRRILVVDEAPEREGDRTISYFSGRPLEVDDLARRVFDRIKFVAPGVSLDLAPTEYRYRSLSARAYRREGWNALARDPRVTVLRARVEEVEDQRDHAVVMADGRRYWARWVFDSRFQAARPSLQRHDSLVQRFVGWEVELERPVLDPTAATLFDFSTSPGAEAVRFHYVLPFSDRIALFELVTFGAAAREDDLAAYIAAAVAGVGFRILRKEGGESLLCASPFVRGLGRRVLAIGVAGGLLKPSTGYAFTRILEDTCAIVAAVEEGRHPLARVRARRLYRFFDGVFLHLAASRANSLPVILAALFARNPVDRVIRFLDERSSWRDLLWLVLSLPKAPFIRAFFGWIGVRVGIRAPNRQLPHRAKTWAHPPPTA